MYGMYFCLLFFVLQFIATYKGGGIIITISLHTYITCVIFKKCIQTLKLFCLPPTSVMNERSFSHMKLVKSKRCGKLSEKALNDLMMVRLETPGVPKFDSLPSIKTRQMTSSNQRRHVNFMEKGVRKPVCDSDSSDDLPLSSSNASDY